MSSQPGPCRYNRPPKCSRCRNHGLSVLVRGHSGSCAWKHCTCPKCSLITKRSKIQTAQKLLRKTSSLASQTAMEEPGEQNGRKSHRETSNKDTKNEAGQAGREQTVREGPAMEEPGDRIETCPPALPSDCFTNLEYLERQTNRMYPGQPPMYQYHPYPMGLTVSSQGFRSVAPSGGIPLRSTQQFYPLHGAGIDFPQSYFPSMTQFMPHRFMSGIQYLPCPVPMDTVLSDLNRGMPDQRAIDTRSIMMLSEKSHLQKK
ncbi:hypothetical protein GDO86_007827 [Hymenochirus boettgeri]|uniref:DM domain-containing protein n=1 Tax=Hymenochirus boettgeri TaxID=247094 RepID=A0A8T2J2J1_9PIPI|nr:hypothetical protein GDO86_007827 [Hymenochirus boettgeri]